MKCNQPAVADYIASHAPTVLLLLTLAGSLLSGAAWHFIQKAGPRLWGAAVRLWTHIEGDRVWRHVESTRLIGSAFRGTLGAMRFLGIYAVCSFVVALIAVGTFLELAEVIGAEEALSCFDRDLSASLGQHLSTDVLRLLAALTHLGDAVVLAAVVAAIAVTLLFLRRYLLAAACVIAAAGGGTLTLLLKQYFARGRPFHDHGFATVSGYSFPSGHASGSLLAYGLLGYLVVTHTRSTWHIPVVVATVATIVCVGGSRVLLQVHFLTDVLAGWASAGAWLALWIAGLEAYRRASAPALSGPDSARGLPRA